MTDRNFCVWCGSRLAAEPSATAQRSTSLCRECNETFQVEAAHSLHPVEERQPYQD